MYFCLANLPVFLNPTKVLFHPVNQKIICKIHLQCHSLLRFLFRKMRLMIKLLLCFLTIFCRRLWSENALVKFCIFQDTIFLVFSKLLVEIVP